MTLRFLLCTTVYMDHMVSGRPEGRKAQAVLGYCFANCGIHLRVIGYPHLLSLPPQYTGRLHNSKHMTMLHADFFWFYVCLDSRFVCCNLSVCFTLPCSKRCRI
ncbi:hypothetical protein SISNIDRAFT_141699 [Sistotremastrum niveocremeum HHB9708]|uniref:Uncharacterized protein n=1 Tax=Sistotremastrum niveocremeum HHB9708 TaxID=1314777 RepID=A0A165A2I1_9AGAM|nr:hypothetical protein SISNIDRAFT_141699 [Sistotremastrum niveocremeum HHB9708]